MTAPIPLLCGIAEVEDRKGSGLVDAKPDAVSVGLRAGIADGLLTIERRIAFSTWWILSVVVAVLK